MPGIKSYVALQDDGYTFRSWMPAIFPARVKRALGLNHWIDPGVESLGKFYWGDENADDAGLPGPWFP